MTIKSSFKCLFIIIPAFLLITCAGKDASSEDMDAKSLFEKRCTRCHTLDRTNKTESSDYWKSTVQKMKKKFFSGISNKDAAVITEYLIKTRAPQPSAPDQNKDAARLSNIRQ